ncbi:hypothetical protein PM082_004254 [Marasmius tenuissimus]|nr:hypothetical protein PM082_004254 [Marasmius tenuissimus]
MLGRGSSCISGMIYAIILEPSWRPVLWRRRWCRPQYLHFGASNVRIVFKVALPQSNFSFYFEWNILSLLTRYLCQLSSPTLKKNILIHSGIAKLAVGGSELE